MSDTIPLDQQLCFSLYGASMAINRAYKPMLDALGLTYPQYLVLSTLWETDRQTIGAIAERLSLEASTITPLVKRLEQAGFVARQRDTADERRVHVGLTRPGRDLRPSTACLNETLLERSGLTVAQLVDLNTRVQALRDAVASGEAKLRALRASIDAGGEATDHGIDAALDAALDTADGDDDG